MSSTATTTPDTELPPLPSSFDPLAQSSFYGECTPQRGCEDVCEW